jgi:hypothetical protein
MKLFLEDNSRNFSKRVANNLNIRWHVESGFTSVPTFVSKSMSASGKMTGSEVTGREFPRQVKLPDFRATTGLKVGSVRRDLTDLQSVVL